MKYWTCLILLSFVHLHEGRKDLVKIFEWGAGQIKFNVDPRIIKHSLETNKYIPKNNLPLGIAVHPYKPIMFMTIPRWKPGVLSTLNWIPTNTGNPQEPLNPFPNWEVNDIYNKIPTSYKIISVIRIFIDSCDRLWVMDNGDDDKCGSKKQLEPPKILIFDINTNQLIHMYVFNSEIHFSKSSFGKIIVDVTPKTCERAFAYITDVRYPGLLVYDLLKNRSYRIERSYLEREPMKSHFHVGGKKKESGNHIDGIALSGLYSDGYRNLYVSAHTSNKQFITSTKFMQLEEYRQSEDLFFYLGERCSNCQSGGAQVMDELTGVLFYNELNNDALSCWNGDHDNYGPQTQERIAVLPELNYVSDMVITRSRVLVVISDELRKFFYSDGGATIRIFAAQVDELIKGTICAAKYV